MVYDQHYGKDIFEGLKQIYVLLRSGGDKKILANLYVDRVDIASGNTKPFRIRIVNQYNDNHDYFYKKGGRLENIRVRAGATSFSKWD